MKKFLSVSFAAVIALCACNSEKKPFTYRGLSMAMPFEAFIDSLQQRGFAIDSAKTDSAFTRVVMGSDKEKFRLMIAQQNGKVQALQENYLISTNDSTRRMWQELRDQFEKDLGAWPNMPKHGDDHKIAKFDADSGFITVTLENTYKPTLTVLYQQK